MITGTVVYPVGDQVAEMFAAPGTPVAIHNSGPADVWLSTRSNLAPRRGFPLPLNAMVGWDEDKPCYAVTDAAGTIAELVAIANSGVVTYGPDRLR